jgi:uncharacterized membrane protein
MNLKALKDVAERTLRSAAQAGLAVYGLNLADVTNLSLAQSAASAAGTAVLAALMGMLGTKVGSSADDASMR